MREFLAGWIVFQLIIIGWTVVSIDNQVVAKTYDCKLKHLPHWVGVVYPLAVFVPEDPTITKYCEGKR